MSDDHLNRHEDRRWVRAVQIFPFLAVLALVAAAASRLPGFRVPDAIVPYFDTDEYPTHYATYGKGGLRTVADTSQLSQITTLRREPGMVVYVTNQGNFYKLAQDLTTWTVWPGDNTNAVTDGDKGDITVASGVWTIDSGVVTTGKLSAGAVSWVDGHLTEAEASALYHGTNAALTLLQSGDGTGLTSLDGSAVTTGTVAAARIDSAIATDAEVAAGYEPLNSSKYQGTNSNLTTVADLTGGNSSNFYRGDGGFQQVTTNDVPGLVADILAAAGSGSGGGDVYTSSNNVFTGDNEMTNLTVTGTMTVSVLNTPTLNATNIVGDGSSITNLNGDNIASGTVADARIASTIARDSEVAAAYQPLDSDLTTLATLDGGSLTNLDGANIQAGTVNSNAMDAASLALFTASGSGLITAVTNTIFEVVGGNLNITNEGLVDLADNGTISGTRVLSGINAAYLSGGTLSNDRLDADLKNAANSGIASGQFWYHDGTRVTNGTLGTGFSIAGGTLTFTGSDITNIVIDAGAFQGSATNPMTVGTFFNESGSDGFNHDVWDADDTTAESIDSTSFVIPSYWDTNDITATVYWWNASATSGTNAFSLQLKSVLPAAVEGSLLGAKTYITNVVAGTTNTLSYAQSGAISVGGRPTANALSYVRITREPSVEATVGAASGDTRVKTVIINGHR